MVSRHFYDEGFQDRLIPSPSGTNLHFLAPIFKISEIETDETFRAEIDDVRHDMLHQININLHWNQIETKYERRVQYTLANDHILYSLPNSWRKAG